MRKITEIIIHATATRADWWANRSTSDKVAEVKKWHVDGRGWSDIGYHFLIDRDGTVAEGRPIERTGAHVKGHNTGTIGVSLFGGHGGEKDGAFDDNFTEDQGAALRTLIARLQSEYGPGLKLSGHHEYANKACPCFDVRAWFARKAPTARTSPAQSTTLQAAAVQIASGLGAGGTAIGALDGTAQIVAMVFAGVVILAALWIVRERLSKWAAGDR